jgi:predicted transposase YbfD/YdcC
MSCQKTITAKITEGKADYVIGLQGNPGTLLEDVKLYFESESTQVLTESPDKNHGRIEPRDYLLETEISGLPKKTSG